MEESLIPSDFSRHEPFSLWNDRTKHPRGNLKGCCADRMGESYLRCTFRGSHAGTCAVSKKKIKHRKIGFGILLGGHKFRTRLLKWISDCISIVQENAMFKVSWNILIQEKIFLLKCVTSQQLVHGQTSLQCFQSCFLQSCRPTYIIWKINNHHLLASSFCPSISFTWRHQRDFLFGGSKPYHFVSS